MCPIINSSCYTIGANLKSLQCCWLRNTNLLKKHLSLLLAPVIPRTLRISPFVLQKFRNKSLQGRDNKSQCFHAISFPMVCYNFHWIFLAGLPPLKEERSRGCSRKTTYHRTRSSLVLEVCFSRYWPVTFWSRCVVVIVAIIAHPIPITPLFCPARYGGQTPKKRLRAKIQYA